MTETPNEPTTPLTRRPVFWLIVGAVLLGIAVVVVVVLGMSGGRSPEPSPTTIAPTPTSEAPSTPPSEPPATSDPGTPSAVVIPTDCAGIYTRDWAPELGGLVLNPAWSEDEPLWGSNDRGAITMLEGTAELRCAWVQDAGGGDVGIITNVAGLTPEQQDSMAEYFPGAGFTCYEELGGTRCVIEETTDAGEWGESHFLREGVWIATRWANVSPEGYTHDIVAAIFG